MYLGTDDARGSLAQVGHTYIYIIYTHTYIHTNKSIHTYKSCKYLNFYFIHTDGNRLAAKSCETKTQYFLEHGTHIHSNMDTKCIHIYTYIQVANSSWQAIKAVSVMKTSDKMNLVRLLTDDSKMGEYDDMFDFSTVQLIIATVLFVFRKIVGG